MAEERARCGYQLGAVNGEFMRYTVRPGPGLKRCGVAWANVPSPRPGRHIGHPPSQLVAWRQVPRLPSFSSPEQLWTCAICQGSRCSHTLCFSLGPSSLSTTSLLPDSLGKNA